MMWLKSLWRRARGLWRAEAINRELDEEIQFHIDMRTEENIGRGMSPEEARRDAERRFGNSTRIKEQGYEVRGGRWLETFWRDTHFAGRLLVKRPGFAFVAVLSLSLGVGACTAIFSVVDGVLLRPLPYPESDRIVQLRELNEKAVQMPVTEPNFLDLRTRNRSLESLAQYRSGIVNVTGASEPVRTSVCLVSDGFFRVLGVQPSAGRTFLPDEIKHGGGDTGAVAVVSYGFWQRLLGGRADFKGTTLNVYDRSFAVVGVMPPDFSFPQATEVWIPRELFPAQTSRTAHNWSVVARLKPGVSLEDARSDLSAIGKQFKLEHGKDVDAVDMAVVPLQEYLVGNVRSGLLILLGAVGLLLLIACANVANLLLAQATARRKEIVVRLALGATRTRLIRQFITESVLLASIAGALGVLFSLWGVDFLVSLNAQSLPRASEVGVNVRVLAFTFGLSLLTAIILGLVPALRSSGRDVHTNLREASRALTGGAVTARLRGLLVISQVALTLMLLIGAGLLGRSFLQLLRVDPGFRPESAVALNVSLPAPQRDEQRRQMVQFQRQLIERFAQMPGVTAAGGINSLPMTGGGSNGTFLIDNNPNATGYAEYRLATEGYFAAMGIPLLRGRLFEHADGADAQHVAVISQSLARKTWPNEDAIGKRIQFGNMDGDTRLLNIVGIVGDVRERGLEASVYPVVYAYALQRPLSSNFSFVVRANTDPAALTSAMRGQLQALNRDLPANFRTLEQIFSSSLDSRRFSLVLFAAFACVALILAVTGIYGVMSYSVEQRTNEIGIRMALGAQRGDVLKMVIGQGLKLAAAGVLIGLVAAYVLTRVMASLLYGVSATDPLTFVAVSTLLLAVAFLACLIPARRATRVDPMLALRYE